MRHILAKPASSGEALLWELCLQNFPKIKLFISVKTHFLRIVAHIANLILIVCPHQIIRLSNCMVLRSETGEEVMSKTDCKFSNL